MEGEGYEKRVKTKQRRRERKTQYRVHEYIERIDVGTNQLLLPLLLSLNTSGALSINHSIKSALPAISLNSAPGSLERIRVAAQGPVSIG